MVDIRIKDLPLEASPTASEFLAIDLSSTRSATIQSVVEIGRPAASQVEAEAGVNSVKVMTPLTVKQSIASEVGVSIASAAQGLLASTALQPAAIGTTVQAFDTDLTAIAALVSAADKVPYATGSGTWALADFTSAGRTLVAAANATAQRAVLGLGNAATLNVGTTAGTVAAGDDTRIVNALPNASPTATGIMTVGSSPYPDPKNSVSTTANHSNGSANITVANGSQVANGDTINATFVPNYARVISGGGTNSLVMSHNATATGTGTAIQFGNDRWDLTSTLRANTGGFENLYVGQAALGRSTWFNQVNGAGLDFPQVANFVSINPNGASSGVFGSRMSDEATGLDSLQTTISITYVDTNPDSLHSWGHYNQANLMVAAIPVWHANEESSIESFWTTVDIDPYNMNATGSVRVARYDAGIGTYAGGTGPRANLGAPKDISAFIDAPNNDARARAGIVFGSDSLDTDAGRIAPMIAGAVNHAISWFRAATQTAWQIYSDATSGNNSIILKSDQVRSSQNYSVSKAAGISKNIQFQTAGLPRASFGVSASAESGSNVGSDIVVSCFNDAGAFNFVAHQIRRSNGRPAFFQLATLPSFANDAAAGAGGIAQGEFYTTNSAGDLIVKVKA